MAKFLSDYAIKIDRPLVFLCGPWISDDAINERRVLLHNHIISEYQEKSKDKIIYQPVPVIVDDIFDSKRILQHNLNLSLL